MSDSREAFEKWSHNNVTGFSGAVGDSGDYCYCDNEQELWECWKHQQARIDEVLNANERLGKSNEKLYARIAELEKELDELKAIHWDDGSGEQ